MKFAKIKCDANTNDIGILTDLGICFVAQSFATM